MSWRLIDPLKNEFRGEFSALTQSEAKKLGRGWFKWADYMAHKDKAHMHVYKLQRAGIRSRLLLIAAECRTIKDVM